MKVILDLKEYTIDKQKSYYNCVFYKHNENGNMIKLVYEDNVDKVEVWSLDNLHWNFMFCASYYHDFDLEQPLEGVYKECWT